MGGTVANNRKGNTYVLVCSGLRIAGVVEMDYSTRRLKSREHQLRIALSLKAIYLRVKFSVVANPVFTVAVPVTAAYPGAETVTV